MPEWCKNRTVPKTFKFVLEMKLRTMNSETVCECCLFRFYCRVDKWPKSSAS